jgi:hypothetical protein
METAVVIKCVGRYVGSSIPMHLDGVELLHQLLCLLGRPLPPQLLLGTQTTNLLIKRMYVLIDIR